MIGGTIDQSINSFPSPLDQSSKSTRIMSLLYLLCLPIIFLATSLTPHQWWCGKYYVECMNEYRFTDFLTISLPLHISEMGTNSKL